MVTANRRRAPQGWNERVNWRETSSRLTLTASLAYFIYRSCEETRPPGSRSRPGPDQLAQSRAKEQGKVASRHGRSHNAAWRLRMHVPMRRPVRTWTKRGWRLRPLELTTRGCGSSQCCERLSRGIGPGLTEASRCVAQGHRLSERCGIWPASAHGRVHLAWLA